MSARVCLLLYWVVTEEALMWRQRPFQVDFTLQHEVAQSEEDQEVRHGQNGEVGSRRQIRHLGESALPVNGRRRRLSDQHLEAEGGAGTGQNSRPLARAMSA